MFGSDIVDVVIALAFIYFLLSIVASAALESVAQILDWRSKTLREGIGTLLGDPTFQGLARKVYANPLVNALGTPKSDPSYLKDTRFADALLDTLDTAGSAADATAETIKAGIAELPVDSAARKQLEVLLRQSGDQLDQFRLRIAAWFDEGMDRLSGVYARKSRKVIFAVGLLMAILFNVDTIATAQALATNPSSRDAIVQSVAGTEAAGAEGTSAAQAIELLNSIEYGIGWNLCWHATEALPEGVETSLTPCGKNLGGEVPSLEQLAVYIAFRTPGWLFTAFAVTLGAPFWFDTLVRFSNIRAAGKKPTDESGEETKPGTPPSAGGQAGQGSGGPAGGG